MVAAKMSNLSAVGSTAQDDVCSEVSSIRARTIAAWTTTSALLQISHHVLLEPEAAITASQRSEGEVRQVLPVACSTSDAAEFQQQP